MNEASKSPGRASRTATLRKPTWVRRREIALAALAVVGRDGVTALTTSTLAREVGLTSGALFRHFQTMDDIWDEAVLHAGERLEATLPDPTLPPTERLRAMAQARIELLRAEPGIAWLIRSPQASLTLPAQAAAAMRGVVQRSRTVLLGALREGAAEGTIRSEPPPEVLLIPVTATIHALVGLPSIHARAALSSSPCSEDVLDGLFQLIACPGPVTVGSREV